MQGKKDIDNTLKKVNEIKSSSEQVSEQITYLGQLGTILEK